MPDYSSPVVLRSSKCTVEDFVSLDPTPEPWVTPDPLNYPILTCVCQCNAIHRSITEQFKSAVVYGKSVKHQPQRVGLSHELADEDIGTWRLTQVSACRHTNRPSQSPSSSGKPRKSRTGWRGLHVPPTGLPDLRHAAPRLWNSSSGEAEHAFTATGRVTRPGWLPAQEARFPPPHGTHGRHSSRSACRGCGRWMKRWIPDHGHWGMRRRDRPWASSQRPKGWLRTKS